MSAMMDKPGIRAPRSVLLEQCQAMIQYGSELGIELPQEALDVVERARTTAPGLPDGDQESASASPKQSPELGVLLSTLAEAHRLLAAAVAPATPSTIQLLAEERGLGFRRYFGATKYARGLSYLAILLFVAFVLLQSWLAADVHPSWLDIVITAFASLIGGTFYVMFALSRQLAKGSFSRNLEGHYTILIILGSLAGTALALLIVQPPQFAPDVPDPSPINVVLTRPLLALLGGFSAQAVYRILERLVATVEALIRGPGDEQVAAQEQAAQARATAEVSKAKSETIQSLQEINAGITPDTTVGDVRKSIDEVISKLVGNLPRGQVPPRSSNGIL